MILTIQIEHTFLFRGDPRGDASLWILAAPPGNSGTYLHHTPGKRSGKAWGFECAECSVFLLCVLVMSKRERAGTEAVVICDVQFSVSLQTVRIPENQVSRSLSAANTACNIGYGMTTAMLGLWLSASSVV